MRMAKKKHGSGRGVAVNWHKVKCSFIWVEVTNLAQSKYTFFFFKSVGANIDQLKALHFLRHERQRSMHFDTCHGGGLVLFSFSLKSERSLADTCQYAANSLSCSGTFDKRMARYYL